MNNLRNAWILILAEVGGVLCLVATAHAIARWAAVMRTDLHRVTDVEPIEPVESEHKWLWLVYLLTLVLAVVASAFYPEPWW